jgi:Predicted dehydrogenase
MRDVTIIGGGVIGCLTARALSQYMLNICLIEKNNDTSSETSKANSGIVHAGFDAPIGSQKARFNVRGSAMMEQTCKELDVHFKQNGSLVLAFDDEQCKTLQEMLERGKENGVEGISIILGDEVRTLEPNVSQNVIAALRAETGGIVCPYNLTHNAAQNAAENGVTFLRNTQATSIKWNGDFYTVQTNNDTIETKYIINAAGLYADEVAAMAGDNSISIYPRRGEYMLMDKKVGTLTKHTIFQVPTKMGKGILVTPTVDGNLLIGPTALDAIDKANADTTDEGLEQVFSGACKSVTSLSKRDIITSFTGLRAVSQNDDFIIGFSEAIPNFINVAGIQSPGLSAAPAIAQHVAELLCTQIKSVEFNSSFIPNIEKKIHIAELSDEDLHKLIQKNPKYGNIICRCETVSEGEIVDAIQCECGADDIDGIKRRTRAGMGRCQGGFCMPRVLEIVSKEKGIPFASVTKNDAGSYILTTQTKGGTDI